MLQNIRLVKCSLGIVTALSIFASPLANAQSSQYKRKAKPAAKKSAGKKAPAKSGSATNQKLDIENLEKRYWAPKDTEFKVVQNRKFNKAKRYNLSVMGGTLFNDSFSEGDNLLISSTHYFDEHNGLEVRLEFPNQRPNEGAKEVQAKGGNPDQNFEDWAFSVNYNWIPFYGKISVLDNKIIYFDMAVYAGLGYVKYTQQVKDDYSHFAETLGSASFNFGISQQYFLSKHWALKLDVSSRYYKEERRLYQDGTSQGSFNQFNTYILFGGTYFFGSGDKEQVVGGKK